MQWHIDPRGTQAMEALFQQELSDSRHTVEIKFIQRKSICIEPQALAELFTVNLKSRC